VYLENWIDKTWLGLGNFRSKAEQVYVYDDDADDEEKKEAQALTEYLKDPIDDKPALKKTKEVQPVLKRSLRLQVKVDARKEEEAKKESNEYDSVLSDIKTHSDSESRGVADEAWEGIRNSIGGLLSRRSEAAANITESTSVMLLEEMLYGVSHQTETTDFRMLSQDRSQWNGLKRFNLKFLLWRTKKFGNLAACLLEGRRFPSSAFSKDRLTLRERFSDARQDWCTKPLFREKAITLLKLLHQLQSFNLSDVWWRLLPTTV